MWVSKIRKYSGQLSHHAFPEKWIQLWKNVTNFVYSIPVIFWLFIFHLKWPYLITKSSHERTQEIHEKRAASKKGISIPITMANRLPHPYHEIHHHNSNTIFLIHNNQIWHLPSPSTWPQKPSKKCSKTGQNPTTSIHSKNGSRGSSRDSYHPGMLLIFVALSF